MDMGETDNKYYFTASGISYASLNGNISYYHKDSHGDVTAITDNNGVTIRNYQFDAFGNQLTQNTDDTNPFRYTGEYQDLCSGLIYLRNRYYDPSIGRFITEDPAKDGLNWYVYCNNDPVNRIDPTGLYDRDAAVEYAVTWWDSTNPQYERFDSITNYVFSLGRMRGDCANFVSQSLVAGGLTMNSQWYINYTYERIGGSHAAGGSNYIRKREGFSAAWAAAEAQYKFFSSDWAGYKNGEPLQIWSKEGMEYNIKYNNIQKGDLMFFAHRDTGEVYHSTIISDVHNNEILFAAHTRDRQYEELSPKLKDDFVIIVRIRDDAVSGYIQ